MAFGQTSGPPANQRQLDRLGELLVERGFDTFREARHRLGLTQRQANGRFTVQEADELIERLDAGAQVEESWAIVAGVEDLTKGPGEGTAGSAFAERVAERKRQEHARAMLDIPDDALADELARRGWCCIPPGA